MRAIITSIILFLALWATLANATDRLTERQQFLQAYQAIQHGDYSRFQQLSDQLRAYPLYPYLQYWELTTDIKHLSEQQYLDFTEKYANTPLPDKLVNNWIPMLGQQKQWNLLVKYYRPSSDPDIKCWYLQALLANEQKQTAYAMTTPMWLAGAQSPVCRPVYAAWEKSGVLTTDLIWRRLANTITNGYLVESYRLILLLPVTQRSTAKLWLRVHYKPDLIFNSSALFRPWDAHYKAIVLDGIARLLKKKPDLVAQNWPLLQKTYYFTDADKQQIIKQIAVGLARTANPQALSWLQQVTPANTDQIVREWRVRSALREKNWPLVSYWIKQLTPSERATSCWRYWQARALQAQGDTQNARAIYQSLATQINYYGLLASKQLRQSYQPMQKSLPVNHELIAEIGKNPGVQRAEELFYVNFSRDARDEWRAAVNPMSPPQLLAAAQLAYQMHWYDRAIVTSESANVYDDLALRFPLAYSTEIMQVARELKMDPVWIYAIMRQESEFMSDSVSSVGALGLMQVMPETGRLLAARLTPRFIGHSYDLMDLDDNIYLGAAFLRDMAALYKQNFLFVAAAYNAGPGALQRWLAFYDKSAPDIWVENIPYQETRNYVKQVMLNAAIYQQRLSFPSAQKFNRRYGFPLSRE